MKISLSYSEVNEVLIAWVKAHINDLPPNAEFNVSSSSYGESVIWITEPTPSPTKEQEVA